MIKSIENIIKKICSITDRLAGICFASVMLLVVLNIIMRNIFKLPITGTVELVGLLTATGLGLALSNCEMQDFNTAMDVFTEKLPQKAQKVLEIFVYLISLCFWSIVVWRVFIYAFASIKWVTSTTSIPHFPFLLVLCMNLFFLCVVLLYKLVCAFQNASAEFRKPKALNEGNRENEEKEESK